MMEEALDATTRAGTLSAGRVADVLLAVGDAGGPVGVSELARRTGLSKAVVHRILQSLVTRDLVSAGAPSGAYHLGGAALRLGLRAVGSLDLRVVALPVLRRLQAATGETTTVSLLVGTSRIYVDQVVSSKEIRMTVDLGVPFPLHAGGSGKAILAFTSEDIRSRVLDGGLARLTASTISDRSELERTLEQVRRDGVAMSLGERESGAASVAAPVLGLDRTAIGSVSICGPRDRLDLAALERFAPLARRAAVAVTEAIAHPRAGA